MRKISHYTFSVSPLSALVGTVVSVSLLGVMGLAGFGAASLAAQYGNGAQLSSTPQKPAVKKDASLLLSLAGRSEKSKTVTSDSDAELGEEHRQLIVRLEVLQSIIESAIALDLNYEHQHSDDGEEVADHTDTEPTPGIGGGDEQVSEPALAPMQNIGLELMRDDSIEGTSQLIEFVDSHLAVLRGLPLGSPVKGWVSSTFGRRRSPFTKRVHQHKGIDIAVDRGSRVVATANGLVVEAASKGSYGRTVRVDHGNGMITLYGHLSKILVEKGDLVCAGQEIGLVGSTGRSTGPHVHYELRFHDSPRNPEPFIHAAGLLKAAI